MRWFISVTSVVSFGAGSPLFWGWSNYIISFCYFVSVCPLLPPPPLSVFIFLICFHRVFVQLCYANANECISYLCVCTYECMYVMSWYMCISVYLLRHVCVSICMYLYFFSLYIHLDKINRQRSGANMIQIISNKVIPF